MKSPVLKQMAPRPVSSAEGELQRILAMLIRKHGIFAVAPFGVWAPVEGKHLRGPGQSQSYLDRAPVRISGRNEIFLARLSGHA
jgi:hypothetical protein